MKKRLLFICLFATGYSLFLSCEKGGDDSTGPGPDATYITSGYLGTMGTTVTNTFDTLFFDVSAYPLGRPMAGFGFVGESPQDQVTFITQNNGTSLIKMISPYGNQKLTHFWIRPDPSSFPVYPYYFSMAADDKADITELQFIIKRSDTDSRKFTIESKKYPGNYLNIERTPGTLQTTQSHLIFSAAKKEFFFIAQ